MPTESPWFTRLPDLPEMKSRILGFLTFANEPIEMLEIFEQLRKSGKVDDLTFERAVAELLQFGFISNVPETVKLCIGRIDGHC